MKIIRRSWCGLVNIVEFPTKAPRRCASALALAALWFAWVEFPALAQTPDFAMVEVADGDFVHFGQVALTSIGNAGDIANLGVVVGRDAAAIIDTGGSVAVSEALLAALRKITDKPLRYVINTHEHPDHVFGNAALNGPGVTFVGHRNLPASMRAHGPFYLRSYVPSLGQDAIAQVRLIEPSLLVEDSMQLDLGDRTLLVIAWPQAAHSDCDLTVLDERSHTLFGGDLVFLDHVPIVDGNLKGWLALLPKLAALPATSVVPGHGKRVAPWPQALADEQRYLTTLATDARRLIESGSPLADAVPLIGVSEQTRWQLFDDYHPRNATAAFSELEWE